VWDLRSLECIQTFAASPELGGMRNYLKVTHKNLIIAANNRRFQEFEFSYSNTPELTDDQDMVCALYNEVLPAPLSALPRARLETRREHLGSRLSSPASVQHMQSSTCCQAKMLARLAPKTKITKSTTPQTAMSRGQVCVCVCVCVCGWVGGCSGIALSLPLFGLLGNDG